MASQFSSTFSLRRCLTVSPSLARNLFFRLSRFLFSSMAWCQYSPSHSIANENCGSRMSTTYKPKGTWAWNPIRFLLSQDWMVRSAFDSILRDRFTRAFCSLSVTGYRFQYFLLSHPILSPLRMFDRCFGVSFSTPSRLATSHISRSSAVRPFQKFSIFFLRLLRRFSYTSASRSSQYSFAAFDIRAFVVADLGLPFWPKPKMRFSRASPDNLAQALLLAAPKSFLVASDTVRFLRADMLIIISELGAA